jgi:hypothetical protein
VTRSLKVISGPSVMSFGNILSEWVYEVAQRSKNCVEFEGDYREKRK